MLTKVGLQLPAAFFWGKVPMQPYGRSTTTAKRKARRNNTTHRSTKYWVSDFPLFIETTLRPYLQSRYDTFQTGNISHSLDAWKEMTSDKDILSTVMGMSIEFCGKPIQHYLPKSARSERETQIISAEVNKLLSKGAFEVYSVHRSKRRLLLCSNLQRGQKIPPVPLARYAFSDPMLAKWPLLLT